MDPCGAAKSDSESPRCRSQRCSLLGRLTGASEAARRLVLAGFVVRVTPGGTGRYPRDRGLYFDVFRRVTKDLL